MRVGWVKAPACLKALSLPLADQREQQLDSTARTLEHLEEHALPCQTDRVSIFALVPATDYLTVWNLSFLLYKLERISSALIFVRNTKYYTPHKSSELGARLRVLHRHTN